MSITLERLEKIGLVQRGKFTLKNGDQSDTYFDIRGIMSYPSFMAEIIVDLAKLVPKLDWEAGSSPTSIVGVPTGAIPFACALSQYMDMPLIMIRDAKKDYGLKRQIEGKWEPGNSIILIEDVITTGSSVLEAINILETAGLKIHTILTILDRCVGGVQLLRNKGYDVKSLLFFGSVSPSQPVPLKIQEPGHPKTRLINIIMQKRSNLVVALDLTSPMKILNILWEIGNEICAVKLHLDIIDFSEGSKEVFGLALRRLASDLSFLVIEDRKYADIPYISLKQYESNQVDKIADMVTVHGVCGESLIREFNNRGIQMLLVHDMSTEDPLIDNIYSARVKDIGLRYENVIGYISKKKIPGCLTFTPGVKLVDRGDNMGQTYQNIGGVATDIFIVGRGIYESKDIVESTKVYRRACFETLVPKVRRDLDRTSFDRPGLGQAQSFFETLGI